MTSPHAWSCISCVSNGLRTQLLNVCEPRRRPALEAIADLEARLERALEAGRAAWPQVALDAKAWVEHLAVHLGDGPERALEALHSDFYLAAALTAGDRVALDLFTRVHLPRLKAVLQRRSPGSGIVDEVLATLEDRLLVSGPNGTRIAHYSGRGSLDRFLRAAAVNQLMNKLRTPQADGLSEGLASSLIDVHENPELSVMSRDAREVFAAALQAGFQSLPDRQRLLLKLHTFENATINDLGRMYQVHKVTAFRWLEEAREQLRAATVKHLREHHRVPESELESFIRQLPPSLEASLKTIFRSLEGA